jgi:hypothetical protein
VGVSLDDDPLTSTRVRRQPQPFLDDHLRRVQVLPLDRKRVMQRLIPACEFVAQVLDGEREPGPQVVAYDDTARTERERREVIEPQQRHIERLK